MCEIYLIHEVFSKDSLMMVQRVFLVIAGIWLGGLCIAGYLVAPTIFSVMTDRQAAGVVAGEVFKNMTLFTLIVCTVLLIFSNVLVKRSFSQFRNLRWILLGILFLTLIGGFVLQPWMNGLREAALAGGAPVMASPQGPLFGTLHGISSVIYLLETSLGLLLFWKASKV